jgi:hypothetical protein
MFGKRGREVWIIALRHKCNYATLFTHAAQMTTIRNAALQDRAARLVGTRCRRRRILLMKLLRVGAPEIVRSPVGQRADRRSDLHAIPVNYVTLI